MTVLSVLSIDKTSRIELNSENFISVLEKAKDHPLAIISIVGKSREGKSYALNHFIRYLKSGGKDYWDQQELSADEKFPSSDGPHPVTLGVNIWSEPFFCEHKGKEVAILLLDCQGFYDMTLDTEKSAAIFALSSLLSSVLIYNVTTKLDMEVLEKVQEFSKYAALVSSTTDAQAGVKTALTFLVRDFKYTKHFSLGFHNSEEPAANIDKPGNYFHHIFPIPDAAGDKNATLKVLQACFNDIGIFVMPHPGYAFDRDPDINEPGLEFRNRLREMVEYTLSHLVTKQLGSEQITGKTFKKYVKMLAQLCQNGKFPDYPTIQRETADLQNQLAITKALDVFKSEFVKIPEQTLFSEVDFKNKYQPSFNDALQVYNAHKSLATKDEVVYIENLELQCIKYFETRMVENRNKINKRAAELALNTFKEEFACISESFCENEFEAKFYSSWEVAENIFNSEKSSKSEGEDKYIHNLKKDCRNYFEKTCKVENRNRRNGRAIELALKAFKEEFAKITDLFCEKEFESKFYTFWKAAVKTFNSEKISNSEDEVVYLQKLMKECRNFFEETCMNVNRSRRNERAKVLAIKTFCDKFDRMFGLRKNNQEQIQDVTEHMHIESEVDATSSDTAQRSWLKRFSKNLENVWSERGSLKEKEFDKLLSIALAKATTVLETNAITSNDDDFKKLSKFVEDDCTLKFNKIYKRINTDRRKSLERTRIALGALTVITCGGFLAGVAGAAAVDALHTGFNSSTVESATANENGNQDPVVTGASMGLNSSLHVMKR
ncbi:unnamed protein product [Allacma fusca]|uniref:GB1/RHD3-type G domain-containing protein n=1 Tax=Allacma fusca TaxID=39272 RepID=A0A8J2JFQ3_9HEXA|nr:unnamed protein product [Allacma fusca]